MQACAAAQRVEFGKGHDGLAPTAQAELGFAPKAGVMVVFRFRRGNRVKVLFWVSHGRASGCLSGKEDQKTVWGAVFPTQVVPHHAPRPSIPTATDCLGSPCKFGFLWANAV